MNCCDIVVLKTMLNRRILPCVMPNSLLTIYWRLDTQNCSRRSKSTHWRELCQNSTRGDHRNSAITEASISVGLECNCAKPDQKCHGYNRESRRFEHLEGPASVFDWQPGIIRRSSAGLRLYSRDLDDCWRQLIDSGRASLQPSTPVHPLAHFQNARSPLHYP